MTDSLFETLLKIINQKDADVFIRYQGCSIDINKKFNLVLNKALKTCCSKFECLIDSSSIKGIHNYSHYFLQNFDCAVSLPKTNANVLIKDESWNFDFPSNYNKIISFDNSGGVNQTPQMPFSTPRDGTAYTIDIKKIYDISKSFSRPIVSIKSMIRTGNNINTGIYLSFPLDEPHGVDCD